MTGLEVQVAISPSMNILSLPKGGDRVTATRMRPFGFQFGVGGGGGPGLVPSLTLDLGYSTARNTSDVLNLWCGARWYPSRRALTSEDGEGAVSLGTTRTFDTYALAGLTLGRFDFVTLTAEEEIVRYGLLNLGVGGGLGVEFDFGQGKGNGAQKPVRFNDSRYVVLFGEARADLNGIALSSPALQAFLFRAVFGARLRF